MWQVLPKFGVFKITAFILAVITTSFFIWSTEGWLGLVSFFSDGGPGELLRVITPIVLSFLGVIWFLGAIAWKLLWKSMEAVQLHSWFWQKTKALSATTPLRYLNFVNGILSNYTVGLRSLQKNPSLILRSAGVG